MTRKAYLSYKYSGNPKVGSVPNHWRCSPIKRLIGLCTGENITSADISDVGPYPVVGHNETPIFTNNHTHEGRFLLIGRFSLCGKIFEVNGKLWVSERSLVVNPLVSLNLSWLGYLLKVLNLEDLSSTFDQPNISAGVILSQVIAVPPVYEQNAIAEFLDQETTKIDNLIAEQRRLIEYLTEKQQAVISEAVTGGTDTGWNLIPLGYLVAQSNRGEDIAYVHYGDGEELIYSCALEPSACDYVGFPTCKRTGPKDLLLSLKASVYVYKPVMDSIYSSMVQRIKFHQNTDMDFIYNAVQKSATEGLCGYGVSAQHYKYKEWKSLPIPIPSYQEQQTIATFLNLESAKTSALVSECQSAITLLLERRTALIADAVTGKIDVRGLLTKVDTVSK